MSTSPSTSAISATPEDWVQMDWAHVEEVVRRLQVRIVKAVQAGNWRKVKALQRLLARSFCGKALAVQRVTENRGKRTPGVDGEVWHSANAKRRAIECLKRRGYQPRPLRRVLIPKAGRPGEHRPLGIPTMTDRAMQALYLLGLEAVAETLADRNSYGFRPRRSTADAIQQCHTILSGHDRAQWVLEGDIKGCFDHISHDWLLSHVPMDKEILRKWLKVGFIEKGRLFPTEAGTPQGGIISPALANMVLDGLEAELEARYGTKGNRKAGRFKVNLVRYADDFVVTGSSKELLETDVKPLVRQFLAVRGLALSEAKTKVTHVAEGFDFLGQSVHRWDGKIIITPSRKNVQAFKDQIREIFETHRTAKQENLISILNPVIRGWANYHRAICAARTFASMDSYVWRKTWQWAKRRHLNKNSQWIKDRYFDTWARTSWKFCARLRGTDGRWHKVELARASHTRIRRQVKIIGEANPFDPRWADYFENRRGSRNGGASL